MKKHLIALALLSAPIFVFAAPNTLQFQGEVADQTCDVRVNGNAANATVLLATVAAAQLTSARDTAGQTTFTVGVSGCAAPVSTSQAINTLFVGNLTTMAGNISNTGDATRVAPQLLDPAAPNSPFDVSCTGHAAPGLVLNADETSVSHDFAVRYVTEEGGATPGSVLGSVQYSVVYQ